MRKIILLLSLATGISLLVGEVETFKGWIVQLIETVDIGTILMSVISIVLLALIVLAARVKLEQNPNGTEPW